MNLQSETVYGGRAGAGLAAAFIPARAVAGTADGFADGLLTRLNGYAVGGQFTIVQTNGSITTRAFGPCRTPFSGAPRAMSVIEKLNCASVSKAITAAALVRALYDNPSVSLDSPFAPHLPSYWTVHSTLQNVTFK